MPRFRLILASLFVALTVSPAFAQVAATAPTDLDRAKLEFEREKWRSELELRGRELAIKEREQRTKEGELELKRKEQASSKWTNPLVLAILAAVVAALGNAVVAVVNGRLQRQLDADKRKAELALEENKAESTRILEMIKTPDTEAVAQNLSFLLDSGLVASPGQVQRLRSYLATRKPGTGPSLPATPRFSFEPSDPLTASLQQQLEHTLSRYIEYLDRIGLSAEEKKALIRIDRLAEINAYYHPDTQTIVIDSRIANDPYAALREYTHHVLAGDRKDEFWSGNEALTAVESGVADYFAASFLDSPVLGAVAAKVLMPGESYIRRMDHQRTYREGPREGRSPIHGMGEIWGGAFWEMRERLTKDVFDPLLVTAWRASGSSTQEFLASLLQTARAKRSKNDAGIIREILERREFPVPS